jgi:hypothetical protein
VSEPTPRHGNRFVDTAVLNPRRASERRIEEMDERRLATMAHLMLANGQPLGHDEREALALSIWHSPQTSTGRSTL